MSEMQPDPGFVSRRNRPYLYVCLALLALFAIASTSITLIQLHQQTERRVALSTQSLAKSIELTFAGMISSVDVALKMAVDEMEAELARATLDHYAITRKITHQESHLHIPMLIRATDEYGLIRYGAGTFPPFVDVSDRDRFIYHRDNPDGGLFITRPTHTRSDNEWIWMFARRINKPDGSFGGIVYAQIPVRMISSMISNIQLEEKASISLRDANLNLVTRYMTPDKIHLPDEDNGSVDALKDALRANPGEGTYASSTSGFDNISRTHSYQRDPRFGFVVEVSVSNDVAFANWRQQAGIILALLAAFLAMLFIIARLIRHSWRRQEQVVATLMSHEAELEQIAHYDPVTHLPNRNLLFDRLRHSMAKSMRDGSSLAVAYLDMDGFKAVNDQHGHAVGDQLLVALAQRMNACIREADTLARLGGDEFVAILESLERPEDCLPALDRLLQAASSPFMLDNSHIQVSASIGVTIYPQDNSDADILLRHADFAMYQAKQSGRNRYHFFDKKQAAEDTRPCSEQLAFPIDAQ